ncbi:LAETG motif-containing sortase-dependent surface protein [Streptomyces sp. NPDC050560]|uniref:LAETG motif-containing sortase-dependent surface protein n=1 Tax=Streptomyces sp. NPDC050560 TaxID=3365630 RepID=UPI00378EFC6F
MKGPTRAWKRSGVLIGAAAAGIVGVGLCAVPASAHTPVWSVSCSEVTVDLSAYNGNVKNTVSVQADGKDLLAATVFGGSYHNKLKLPEHSSELSVHLVVQAGDGKQYSKDETKTSPVCEGTPPTKPSSPSSPSQKPSEKPSQQPSEKPTESAPASPVPAGDNSQPPKDQDLAETGSSSSTPIIAGAAAVVVVAGGGILIATRRRSAARH